jgi:hypothetical protein
VIPRSLNWVRTCAQKERWAKIAEHGLGEPAAERAARVSVDVVERLAKAGAMRFIVPGDEEWPDGLDDLQHAEPIQRRGGAPLGLGYAARTLGSPYGAVSCHRRG